MTHINVETMKVTTPVYTMFIVLSLAVCLTENEKNVSYYILKTIKCVKIKNGEKQGSATLMENTEYQFYARSSSNQHNNISTIIYVINLSIADSTFYSKIICFVMGQFHYDKDNGICPCNIKRKDKEFEHTFFMICRYLDLVNNQKIFYSKQKVVTKLKQIWIIYFILI